MAIRVVRRPWLAPPERVTRSQEPWLAAYLGMDGDRGERMPSAAAVSTTLARTGVINAARVTLGSAQVASLTRSVKVTSQWTVLLVINRVSAVSTFPYLLGHAGAANAVALTVSHSSLSGRAGWYDGAALKDSGVTLPIGTSVVLALSFDGSTYAWAANGQLANSASGVATGGTSWQLATATVEGNVNDVGLLAFAGRAYKGAELAGLTANPWQIFEPATRIISIAAAASFSYTGSGGLSLGGSATAVEANNYAQTSAGGLSFAGSATAAGSANYAQAATGGLAFGGTAPATSTSAYAFAAAGGLTFGGAGTAAEANNYSHTAAGGLALGGVATYQVSGGFDYIASGGLALAGAAGAAFTASHLYAASGGIVLGGTAGASASGSNVWTGSGGISFGGAATAVGAYAYRFTGAGGLVLAGSALCSFDAGQLPSIGSDFYRYTVPRESLSFRVPGESLTFSVPSEDLTYRVPST